jgi:hypothetical protein
MELMPQQTSLIITTSRLPDAIRPAVISDHSKQITQENKQAQHIRPQVVDSAIHFLRIARFFR